MITDELLKSIKTEVPDSPEHNDALEGQTKQLELSKDDVFGYIEKNEGQLLEYLSAKQGRELKSWEDLRTVEEKIVEKEVERVIEKEPILPEAVKAFNDYHLKTGRGLDDYLKIQKDWSKESEEYTVKEYLRQTKGFDGEELDEYYNLKFKVDEDELDERTSKTIKFEFKQTYRDALNYMTEQKKNFELPKPDSQRALDVAEKEVESRRVFAEGMLSAIEQTDEIVADGFAFKVGNKDKTKQEFQSLESIMREYSKEGFTDFKRLFQHLYAGRNVEAIVKAAKESAIAAHIEEETKKMHNHNTQPVSGGEPAKIDIKQAARPLFGYR